MQQLLFRVSGFRYHFDNTSISQIECPDGFLKYEIWADCGGEVPEVNCTCCSHCCDDATGRCEEQASTTELDITDAEDRCQASASLIADQAANNPIQCTCNETGYVVETEATDATTSNKQLYYRVSCDFAGCPTCNEDSTICGTVNSVDLSFLAVENKWRRELVEVEFGYYLGRGNATLSLTEDVLRNQQVVTVNGQECTHADWMRCQDGHLGYKIDCSNVLNISGPKTYDPCWVDQPLGGVLDVFYWTDWDVYSGCGFQTQVFTLF